MTAKVKSCHYYPIKSCGGTDSTELLIGKYGPIGDRQWMIVNDHGKFVSQRTVGKMALIKPVVTDEHLILQGPGMMRVSVPLVRTGPSEKVIATIWKDKVEVDLEPGLCHEWLSEFLKISCRLVRMGESYQRPIDEKWGVQNSENSLSDGFPLLVTNQSSLQKLNDHLESPVGMNRFRPNVVISGTNAFDEKNWKNLLFPNCQLKVVKPCTRCILINVDPNTGERPTKDPLRTLGEVHRTNGKIVFGQNAIPMGQGKIVVGDSVSVT